MVSGSDDEKKLEKAERAAERKVMEKRKSARPGNYRAMPKFLQPADGLYTMGAWARPAGGQPGQQVPVRAQISLSKQPVIIGPCYYTGETGHFKRFCPKLVQRLVRWCIL